MQSHCIGIGSGSLGSGNNKVGDWNDKQTGDPSPSTTRECKADGQLKKTSPKNRCSLHSKITDSIHHGFLLPTNVPGMVWTLVSLSWIIKTSKQAGEPSQLQIICTPSHSKQRQSRALGSLCEGREQQLPNVPVPSWDHIAYVNWSFSYHKDNTDVCFQEESIIQHACIKMSAVFQYAIALFHQENLFRSCKMKSVLNRSRHNGN